MIVYRIQHKRFKHGPYRSDVDRSKWATRSHATDKHPNFWADELLRKGLKKRKLLDGEFFNAYALKFAFDSLKSLRAWFSPTERKRLKRIGFELVSYKVADEYVVIGNKQVMYYRRQAKSKQIIPWTKVLK